MKGFKIIKRNNLIIYEPITETIKNPKFVKGAKEYLKKLYDETIF